MDFKLSGKVVFIISPEPWGKMRMSKHHYAIELALLGNEVYFIEPPRLTNEEIVVRDLPEHPALHAVAYKPVFRGKRFLPKLVYRAMLRWQVKSLLKKIGKKPDLVLCFHPFLLENLGWFKAAHAVYFAADHFYADVLPPEVFSADLCVAVSDTIYERLLPSGNRTFLIQHGLNRHFAQIGREVLMLAEQGNQPAIHDKVLRVGYAGNLLMGGIDREMMKAVIAAHPELKFVFWGQYDLKGGNLVVGMDKEIVDFIDFLMASPNVELKGVVSPEELSRQMLETDVFWICHKIGQGKIWDGSNSHKLLEYLSTGRPVVAHYVSSYKDAPVLDMLRVTDNAGYLSLFNEVINSIKRNDDAGDGMKRRISFALSNTYEKQIRRIEGWINE